MLRLLLLLATASSLFGQCVSPTIMAGSDTLAASRSVINANFTNLSDCKAPLASPTFTGTVTGSFSGPLAGNATTATALAANPTDCSANQYAISIAANGNLTCASITSSQVSGIPHPFGATFDGGGSAIAANSVAYMHLPYACTLQAWNIAVDTGTATAKVWKVASGTAIPTAGNSINTSGIAISSNTNVRSTTLSDFTTTTVTAHDIAAVTLTAVSGATKAVVTLECQ